MDESVAVCFAVAVDSFTVSLFLREQQLQHFIRCQHDSLVGAIVSVTVGLVILPDLSSAFDFFRRQRLQQEAFLMRLHGRQRQLKHGVQHLKHLQQPDVRPPVDSSSPWSDLEVNMHLLLGCKITFLFTSKILFLYY